MPGQHTGKPWRSVDHVLLVSCVHARKNDSGRETVGTALPCSILRLAFKEKGACKEFLFPFIKFLLSYNLYPTKCTNLNCLRLWVLAIVYTTYPPSKIRPKTFPSPWKFPFCPFPLLTPLLWDNHSNFAHCRGVFPTFALRRNGIRFICSVNFEVRVQVEGFPGDREHTGREPLRDFKHLTKSWRCIQHFE